MSKRFRFWSRCVLVATMAVLVTFNPAWAGRGLRGWLNKRAAANCGCEVVCCDPAPICNPAPMSCCEAAPVCCDMAPSVSGCEGLIAPSHDSSALPMIESSPVAPAGEIDLPSIIAPMQQPSVSPEASPSDTKKSEPEIKKPEILDPEKTAAPKAEVTPPSVDDVFGNSAAPKSEPPTDKTPATDVAPANDIFGAPSEPEKPSTTTPEPMPPTVDPFGAPSTEPAVTAPADDLFGAPSTPTEPAPTAPADDLFGTPSTQAEPAPTTPADDLFGTPSTPTEPAVTAPADDLFGTPSAPAETTPAAAADDLFGTPSTPVESAPSTPADDLFGTPSTDTPAANAPAPADDLFGTPAPADKPADDLFGNPASIEEPKKEKADDPFSDIFSENKMRVWQDNTGNFKVEAQLAEIHSDSIRLLKSNGNYCKVPLRRLSTSDLKLVEKIASRLPEGDVKMVSINKVSK